MIHGIISKIKMNYGNVLKFNKDIKQYILVLSSNIVSMGLGFIINIISTNVMQTTDFGYYRAFINSLIMLSSFSMLGFHWTFGRQFAIIKTPEQKRSLNSCGIVIIMVLSVITLCLVGIISFFYKIVLDKDMPSYIMLASLFIYVYIFQYYIQQKLQGENRMITLSFINIFPQLLISILMIIALILSRSVSTKEIIIWYVVSSTIVLVYFLREAGFTFRINNELKTIIQENKKHGLQLYFGSLFSVSISQLLGILIATIGGLEQYAFYSLGVSLASPMALVASTMGIVQYKKNVNNEYVNRNDILVTLFISMLAFALYYIILNNFMHFLISNMYTQAISYAKILMFYYTMMGLGDYFNKLINSKGNGKLLRNGAIITGCILIVFSSFLIPMFKVKGLIIANLISGFSYLLIMFLTYRHIGKARKID